MKTNRLLTCLIPFVVCFAQAPALAADQTPAPANQTATADASELPPRTDPLIDPLTGTPYIAVHNGDIVESVIFIKEFRRAHHEEHAVLLIGDIDKAPCGTIDPAVAFTWKSKVYFHGYAIGDVLVPDLTPEQVSDGYTSRLHKTYMTLLHYYLQQSFEKIHVTFPLSAEKAYSIGATDSGPHQLPNELPGDTDDIQAQRVRERLINLTFPNTKAYRNVSQTDKFGKSYTADNVAFDFENFAYDWNRRGCSYLGLAGKVYLPSLLDNILFSIDYQKENPTEKVSCFLHAASGGRHMPGLTVSTTVYTKNGQLWFHHSDTGDLPCPLSFDDLKDASAVIKADLAAYLPAAKKFGAEDVRLRRQPPSALKAYRDGFKAPDLSVSGVLNELQNRGIDAKIVVTTDTPRLVFVWENKSYTYIPILGCYANEPAPSTASN
jgi:hypothetical protein